MTPSKVAPLPGELLVELLSVVREISSLLEPERLLPTIARELRRIVDYSVLDIFLPEADGTLLAAYVEGDAASAARPLRLRLGEGIVGTAAQLRQPVFVPDVRLDARYLALSPGVRTELAMPLLHRDELVGVLNIEGPEVEAFGPDTQVALRVLARHLGAAIENATLYRETRRYAGLLATLYEIGKEAASILDLDELLHRLAESVKRVIDYEIFGILLLEPGSDELVLRKSVRYGTYGAKTRIALGQGLCGTAALLKQPILVGNVQEDPRYLPLIPETRSELVVPLVHKDRLVGVFDLESSVLDRFTEEHVKMLTLLASPVAVAIENARLVDELKRRDARRNKELGIAGQVQHALFPEECPAGGRWEAAARFRPARELGGDLYDFYELGQEQLGLAVGDVAGKGVPAALYAAFVSGLVRARAFERSAPSELMARANRTLKRRGVEGLFCTLAYARFDFAAGELRLSSSGLPYPLHFRARDGSCAKVPVAGLPLGAFDESSYDELALPIAAGDVLLFHSDGLSEAYNGRESYGQGRMLEGLRASAQAPAEEIAERLLADLDAFLEGADPGDDVTLVVVKVR